MAKPKRIQRRRVKGWRMPPNAVFVGRPTKWGNPFSLDKYQRPMYGADGELMDDLTTLRVFRDSCRRWAVHDFRVTLSDELIAAAKATLRGKDLVCWCPLDQPCHADVLLEIANE